MRSLSMIKPNSEKCHIKRSPAGLQRQTRWETYKSTYNVGLSTIGVAELHQLAWFGSNFTAHSWVGRMLYVDNNLHLF